MSPPLLFNPPDQVSSVLSPMVVVPPNGSGGSSSSISSSVSASAINNITTTNSTHHGGGSGGQSHAAYRLPDRNVSEDTIVNAYMSFIFYCNPALPSDCDTESLREAFRTPPKSGGKSFSPFLIYELVRQFYNKEVKTWTELTIKLGVEPPDPSKDESAQKVAQYGVRLKKWMHSMHVKSFFEYLMDIPNEYWTTIPQDLNPISQPIRDGVAIEDDMALRALLPHIRPKRGRKRPDEENATTSSPAAQRQRLSPTFGIGVDNSNSISASMDQIQTPATAWPSSDVAQVPLTRWPQSAITPTTARGAFWDDSLEPKSAVTPSRPTQRRGAKNVSSAWKLGGQDASGKTRGRPPINRTPVDTPTVSTMNWPSSHLQHEVKTEEFIPPPAILSPDSTAVANGTPSMKPPTPTTAAAKAYSPQDGARPARPSISLQVPKRNGGTVRLATPPPPPPPPPHYPSSHHSSSHHPSSSPNAPISQVPSLSEQIAAVTNYSTTTNGDGSEQSAQDHASRAATGTGAGACGGSEAEGHSADFLQPGDTIPDFYFARVQERANIDDIMAYFIRVTLESSWFDADGKADEPATVEEASAIINSTLQTMYSTSGTVKEFLINLSALAGARMLMTGLSKCQRLGERENGVMEYQCEWEYRFGPLSGYFNMTSLVPTSMYKRPKPKMVGAAGTGINGDSSGDKQVLGEKHWEEKYRQLLRDVEDKDTELFRLRNSIISSLKDHPPGI